MSWKEIFQKAARSITEPVGGANPVDSRFTSITDCIRNGTAEDLATWISKRRKSLHADHTVTVSKRNNVEMTAIHYAALLGMADKVKMLHEAGAKIDAPMSKGYTMPIIAARSKSVETMAYVLEHSKADINAQRMYGVTALIEACTSGNADVVQEILKKNPDLDIMPASEPTALIAAAKGGHTDIVEMLLDAGADINQPDKNGQTALWWALHCKKLETADCLVARNADLATVNDSGTTILMKAAKAGHVPLVQRLLEDGANPNQTDHNENTTLHYTVLDEHNPNAAAVIDLLIRHEVRPDLKNASGDTALTLAERLLRNEPDTVSYLRTCIQNAPKINTDKFTDGSTEKIQTLKTIRLRSKSIPSV